MSDSDRMIELARCQRKIDSSKIRPSMKSHPLRRNACTIDFDFPISSSDGSNENKNSIEIYYVKQNDDN